MKLSHVIVLSFTGMLVTSLSVLVFTSPHKVAQNDLTSNETEPSVKSSASPTPRLTLMLEPDATASSEVPRTNSTRQAVVEQNTKQEPLGWLQLTAVDEPCSFFIDGKPVKLKNDVPLMVRLGPHRVRCERPNGDAIEKRIEVVDEAINPVFF